MWCSRRKAFFHLGQFSIDSKNLSSEYAEVGITAPSWLSASCILSSAFFNWRWSYSLFAFRQCQKCRDLLHTSRSWSSTWGRKLLVPIFNSLKARLLEMIAFGILCSPSDKNEEDLLLIETQPDARVDACREWWIHFERSLPSPVWTARATHSVARVMKRRVVWDLNFL